MSSEKDEEWISGSGDGCIIHCINASDDLVRIQSMELWKTLLNVATIRHHQAALDVASHLPDSVVPNIKHHRKC